MAWHSYTVRNGDRTVTRSIRLTEPRLEELARKAGTPDGCSGILELGCDLDEGLDAVSRSTEETAILSWAWALYDYYRLGLNIVISESKRFIPKSQE